MTATPRSGPLRGLRVVEFAGLGPAPFACMLLSDMGADVVLVDRPGARPGEPTQLANRGRTLVHADLKDPAAREQVLALLDAADVAVEGFRPGVMERLGLGPDVLLQRNPRLVLGRMTGWGQDGPLAQAAGHDINYIALTGALHAIGPADRPVPPLNLLGDYGGGSLYLVTGILAALQERATSGRGQVVDAAITDGVISLMTLCLGQAQRGQFQPQREANLLDGGAPWYGVYETADGQHVGLGAIEPQFFARFCELAGLDPQWQEAHRDRARWPQLRAQLQALFRQRPLRAWSELLEGTDACVAPVLPLAEARQHPHHRARASFVDIEGVTHAAPAPRFSRTPSAIQGPAPRTATPLAEVLARWRHD